MKITWKKSFTFVCGKPETKWKRLICAGKYIPCCLDIRENVWLGEAEAFQEVIQAYEKAVQILGEFYDYCLNRVQQEASKNNNHNVLFATQCFLIGKCAVVIQDLLDEGYLKYGDNKMVGVYHLIK